MGVDKARARVIGCPWRGFIRRSVDKGQMEWVHHESQDGRGTSHEQLPYAAYMVRSTCLVCIIAACAGLSAGCAGHKRVRIEGVLPADHPRVYVAGRVERPLSIDGRLSESAWRTAPRTGLFIDIEGDTRPQPALDTRAAMLWDDEYFYFAAWMDEPHLWATLLKRDSIIYRDNDFEIFIDPDGDQVDYDEFEINALGTEFDLRLTRAYRCGGGYDIEWNMAGLKSAVHLRGTLNDPSDRDSGWTVEVAIPWSCLADTSTVPCPPRDGDTWWVNFSRVQWPFDVVDGAYVKPDGAKEDNWVWSPQFAIDMHRPEYWGRVQFADAPPGVRPFVPDNQVVPRTVLRRVQAAIEQYNADQGVLPESMADIHGLWSPIELPTMTSPMLRIDGETWTVTMVQNMSNGEHAYWQLGPDCMLTRSIAITCE